MDLSRYDPNKNRKYDSMPPKRISDPKPAKKTPKGRSQPSDPVVSNPSSSLNKSYKQSAYDAARRLAKLNQTKDLFKSKTLKKAKEIEETPDSINKENRDLLKSPQQGDDSHSPNKEDIKTTRSQEKLQKTVKEYTTIKILLICLSFVHAVDFLFYCILTGKIGPKENGIKVFTIFISTICMIALVAFGTFEAYAYIQRLFYKKRNGKQICISIICGLEILMDLVIVIGSNYLKSSFNNMKFRFYEVRVLIMVLVIIFDFKDGRFKHQNFFLANVFLITLSSFLTTSCYLKKIIQINSL